MALGRGTFAYGVNEGGMVVGDGFIFDGSGIVLPAGTNPQLRAANGPGLAVGSVSPDGIMLAATFQGTNSSRLDLAGLALPDPYRGSYYESIALNLNNAGQIVGQVRLVSGSPLPKPTWAFLSVNGTATSMGTLGGIVAIPRDINNTGQAVGSSTLADGTVHAFRYEAGKMVDLNSLIPLNTDWVLTSANAINDGGIIVGEGLKGGVQHAFRLTPLATGQLPPSILVPPVGGKLALGGSFTLSVGATGSMPLAYQWQHAGTNLVGAHSASFTIASATAFDAGTYQVVVSNLVSSVTSAPVEAIVSDPLLSASLYVGVNIQGAVGAKYRLEFRIAADSGTWTELATVQLTNSTQVYIDADSPVYPQRVYRAVRLP